MLGNTFKIRWKNILHQFIKGQARFTCQEVLTWVCPSRNQKYITLHSNFTHYPWACTTRWIKYWFRAQDNQWNSIGDQLPTRSPIKFIIQLCFVGKLNKSYTHYKTHQENQKIWEAKFASIISNIVVHTKLWYMFWFKILLFCVEKLDVDNHVEHIKIIQFYIDYLIASNHKRKGHVGGESGWKWKSPAQLAECFHNQFTWVRWSIVKFCV